MGAALAGDALGLLQVVLQSGQSAGREVLDVGILSAVGLFLEFGDVLAVVAHHHAHVGPIEIGAGQFGKPVDSARFLDPTSLGSVTFFCAAICFN